MLITNAAILTFDPETPWLANAAVKISCGLVEEIGISAVLQKKYPKEEVFDAKGMFILPGMIIPHFHIYGIFARGIALKENPPQNFLENLQKLWWRLDRKLTREDIRCSAEIALLDCIKSGTTTVFDHHASPNAIEGSLDILAEVFAEFGMRGCLCYEVSDRDGDKIAQAGIAENMRFADLRHKNSNSMLAAKFGLHASFTLSDRTLYACKEVERDLNIGFHFHLGEGETDRNETRRKYGYDSPVKRLEKFGILKKQTLIAHAIDVTEDERSILSDHGVTIVHNPQSNMNNGVGFSDVEEIMEIGITVGLGTDGMTANLFKEIQAASLLQKHAKRNPSAGGNSVCKIVTGHHRSIASQTFQARLGEIKEGNYADLIFIKYNPPTPLNEKNYWFHLLFGIGNLPVEHTMVAGKFLMLNREVLVCDEEKFITQAQERSKKLWERF